jgi:imidazolonepropionase-like amidohydrolase
MESLLAGTQVAAEALGLGDQVGTLEVGKQADLVVTRSNPLQDITSLQNQSNVLQVFKGGQLLVDRLSEPGKAWLRWSM